VPSRRRGSRTFRVRQSMAAPPPPGTPPGMFLYFPKTLTQFDGTTFAVDPQYKIRCHVGHGAQGIICSAIDLHRPNGQEVAVKKLSNALDEVMASKRLLRELRLLRLLRHENLVSLTNIMLPPSTNVLLWKDVYIVSELMDTDLHYVIESGQSLTDDHVQYFTAQLLAGIAYLHRCNVVHRDLKPGNVLVDRNCKLKICDFGLARSCSRQEDRDSQQLLTMYVTTRWYRAPELLCFNVSYGSPVDMWSVGCIVAELFGRQPLFKGTDPRNQLEQIMTVIGRPADEDLEAIMNEGAVNYIESLPRTQESLEEKLPTATPPALDLIRRLLVFNPNKRITAEEARQHAYVQEYNEPSSPPGPEEAAMLSEWMTIASASMLPKEQLQNLIFQEMLHYHPEVMNLHWGAAPP